MILCCAIVCGSVFLCVHTQCRLLPVWYAVCRVQLWISLFDRRSLVARFVHLCTLLAFALVLDMLRFQTRPTSSTPWTSYSCGLSRRRLSGAFFVVLSTCSLRRETKLRRWPRDFSWSLGDLVRRVAVVPKFLSSTCSCSSRVCPRAVRALLQLGQDLCCFVTVWCWRFGFAIVVAFVLFAARGTSAPPSTCSSHLSWWFDAFGKLFVLDLLVGALCLR